MTKEPTIKKKVGHPSMLTDATADKIINALCDGAYIETACKAAGITKVTFYRWLNGADHPEHDNCPRYVAFKARVEQAIAQAELDLLTALKVAGGKDWTSIAWRLERRWPDHWGLKTRQDLNVAGKDGGPIILKIVEDGNSK